MNEVAIDEMLVEGLTKSIKCPGYVTHGLVYDEKTFDYVPGIWFSGGSDSLLCLYKIIKLGYKKINILMYTSYEFGVSANTLCEVSKLYPWVTFNVYMAPTDQFVMNNSSVDHFSFHYRYHYVNQVATHFQHLPNFACYNTSNTHITIPVVGLRKDELLPLVLETGTQKNNEVWVESMKNNFFTVDDIKRLAKDAVEHTKIQLKGLTTDVHFPLWNMSKDEVKQELIDVGLWDLCFTETDCRSLSISRMIALGGYGENWYDYKTKRDGERRYTWDNKNIIQFINHINEDRAFTKIINGKSEVLMDTLRPNLKKIDNSAILGIAYSDKVILNSDGVRYRNYLNNDKLLEIEFNSLECYLEIAGAIKNNRFLIFEMYKPGTKFYMEWGFILELIEEGGIMFYVLKRGDVEYAKVNKNKDIIGNSTNGEIALLNEQLAKKLNISY